MTDYRKAKAKLEKLLDNIHHRFSEASSVYVGELHEDGGYHFHVLFLFFGIDSSSVEKSLRSAIWTAWSGMQAGRVVRRANRFFERSEYFRDRQTTIRYFVGGRAAPPRWWGVRNKAMIRRHSVPVDQKTVSAALAFLEDRRPVAPSPTRKPATGSLLTHKDLESMRDTVDFHQKQTWEAFKKMKVGVDRKVSNSEFLDYLNGVGSGFDAFP